MMKKILFLFLSFVFLNNITLASGVGYIDYGVIYKTLPISIQYQNKIEAKAKEITNYNKTTKNLVATKKTPQEQSQVIKDRRAGQVKLQEEYLTLKQKHQQIVVQKVKTASNIVVAQKKLDIIINDRLRVSGGVDCTQDVLKAIK